MVEILKLFHLVSSSSNSPNKVLVIHMVLLIAITWYEINESIQETLQKKGSALQNQVQRVYIYIYIYVIVTLALALAQ